MNAIDLMLNNATWEPVNAPPVTDGSLYATHSGVLDIPGFGSCKCWRLSNGQAMLDAHDMARLFGFDSPEALANDVAQLGNQELAERLRKPTEFTR
jgi:hypothetical protein